MVERLTDAKLFVYVKPGLMDKNIEDIKGELNIQELIPVIRPIYGLKYIRTISNEILEFYQDLPTSIVKEYLYAQIFENCRLYISEYDGKYSLMMVCGNKQDEIDGFRKVTAI